jgi:hypothetical protein
MASKKLTHIWYYTGYAFKNETEKYNQNSTFTYRGSYGPNQSWMRQLTDDLANDLTEGDWSLLSITPIQNSQYSQYSLYNEGEDGMISGGGQHTGFDMTATNGFMVVVEKYLPPEIVSQIVSIRRECSQAMNEVFKEKVLDKVWRGQTFNTNEEAASAIRQEAINTRDKIREERGLAALLATPSVPA